MTQDGRTTAWTSHASLRGGEGIFSPQYENMGLQQYDLG